MKNVEYVKLTKNHDLSVVVLPKRKENKMKYVFCPGCDRRTLVNRWGDKWWIDCGWCGCKVECCGKGLRGLEDTIKAYKENKEVLVTNFLKSLEK